MPYSLKLKKPSQSRRHPLTESTSPNSTFDIVDVDAEPVSKSPGWVFTDEIDASGNYLWCHTPAWNIFESREAAERALVKWRLSDQFPEFPPIDES